MNDSAKKTNKLIYGVKHKREDVLMSSSSGGVFTALTDVFLQTGTVASSIYNYETHRVEFALYEDFETRNLARGSKYIQTVPGDFYIQVSEWIESHEENMMIFGTGCQIAGLHMFLTQKNLRDRVILVDLICHGSPSPGLWKHYATYLEENNNGKMTYLAFKDKRHGWEKPTAFCRINSKEISLKGYTDWFYMGLTLRDSCYKCPFTKIDRSTSDLTIGDFWNVRQHHDEFYDMNGVSLVIIQTPKGQKIFDKIKDRVEYITVSEKECLQPRLSCPQDIPENRDEFWQDIKDKGIEYCENTYFQNVKKDDLCTRFKNTVLYVMRKFSKEKG